MAIRSEPNGQMVRVDQQAQQIEQQKRKPPETLSELALALQKQIAMVLPKHLTADRMTRVAMSALRTTKNLDKCTLPSFAAAIMACSVLGLEPNTPLGQAYLIPFNKNTKVNGKWETITECQLILGYQGLIDLMRRSGQVASIQAFAVYQGDEFEYELGLNPTLRHKPSEDADRENRLLTHAYCVVRLKDKDADPVFLVMPRARIEKHRKRGASGIVKKDGTQVSTPWDTDYESMALKTVARAISKWAPRSTEVAMAVTLDERSERLAPIAPALPAEVQQQLLEAGTTIEQEPEQPEETEPKSEPQQPRMREPGEDD